METEQITNVSVTAFSVKKCKCLKIQLLKKPKSNPYVSETSPRIVNWNKMRNGVQLVNVTDCKLKIVLKRMMETISLITPSPKMQENNFGYFLKSTIETAATTSELHNKAVINKIFIVLTCTGAGLSPTSISLSRAY